MKSIAKMLPPNTPKVIHSSSISKLYSLPKRLFKLFSILVVVAILSCIIYYIVSYFNEGDIDEEFRSEAIVNSDDTIIHDGPHNFVLPVSLKEAPKAPDSFNEDENKECIVEANCDENCENSINNNTLDGYSNSSLMTSRF